MWVVAEPTKRLFGVHVDVSPLGGIGKDAETGTQETGEVCCKRVQEGAVAGRGHAVLGFCISVIVFVFL